MPITETPKCSHCSMTMKKMQMPPDAAYDSPFMYVCFNDECQYFIKGWRWMLEKFEVRSSYRQMVDPLTGSEKPLPVWSKTAMHDRIIE